jgi:hypothetical protein
MSSLTLDQRLAVFIDMALQLRRDADAYGSAEDQRRVRGVLVSMWYGGSASEMDDEKWADRLMESRGRRVSRRSARCRT